MPDLVDTVRAALSPYVGHMAADTCVRATALSVGKTAADLGPQDLPALEAQVRRLLSPIAPLTTVDSIVSAIKSAGTVGV